MALTFGCFKQEKIRIEGETQLYSPEWPGADLFCLKLGAFAPLRLLWPSGNLLYQGNFMDGQLSGKGKVFLENGDLWYEGEFSDGTMNGQGTLYGPGGYIKYQGGSKTAEKRGMGLNSTRMECRSTRANSPMVFTRAKERCITLIANCNTRGNSTTVGIQVRAAFLPPKENFSI